MLKKVSVSGTYAGKPMTIEGGQMARQANGAVVVSYGDTKVLVTACGSRKPKPGQDFFPLTVDFIEKYYAAGKFPGGFFKRETKPHEISILTARLIDRPIRPLFPEGFINDVQIVATILSFDPKFDPSICATVGASVALNISDIPFNSILGGVVISKVDGKLVMNPSMEELERAEMEIQLAATKDAIMMVEGAASEIPEGEVLNGILEGWETIKRECIPLQNEFIEKFWSEVGKKEKMPFTPVKIPTAIKEEVESLASDSIRKGLSISKKAERSEFFSNDKDRVLEAIKSGIDAFDMDEETALDFATQTYDNLQYQLMREQVVKTKKRIDGRGLEDIRVINSELDLLPLAHGSALFTRGETQSLGIVTIGTADDAQTIDTLVYKGEKTFNLHYNFPPFSVGEVGRMGAPGRREIGHGNLAERALRAVVPEREKFPYTIRVVSEILESNGSSSMASVCSGSLAMMAAGVPIKGPVAGIAMGLVKEDYGIAILSDILGDEDHLGDMDFKVAGTSKGVTSIQMDIKIQGINKQIMETAIKQAHEGRMHILGEMAKTISEPRHDIASNAPRITTFKIDPKKIGEVIGPGGKVIKKIAEEFGVTVNIEDDGTVAVASTDKQSITNAVNMIKGIVTEPEVGQVYRGKVKRIVDFGAFVEILPGCEGLLHVSEIAKERVNKVEDFVKEGDYIEVKLLEIDRMGKMRLSRKALL